jgi:hypothetical protein
MVDDSFLIKRIGGNPPEFYQLGRICHTFHTASITFSQLRNMLILMFNGYTCFNRLKYDVLRSLIIT